MVGWILPAVLAGEDRALHYILSLLKRALPGDAEEIERTSAQWFRMAAINEETGGVS